MIEEDCIAQEQDCIVSSLLTLFFVKYYLKVEQKCIKQKNSSLKSHILCEGTQERVLYLMHYYWENTLTSQMCPN